jgi:hydrogenase maturation protease
VKPRILVAGIGNIFFADDAFGPAVLARLVRAPIDGVRCEDFGIRGLHLAFELLDGYAAAVIVDAVSRGGAPGTLYVIEPPEPVEATEPDAHRMDLDSVFGFVRRLGGTPPPMTIVGCEPESLEEGGEITATVSRAVEAAVPLVGRIVKQLLEQPEERICTEA